MSTAAHQPPLSTMVDETAVRSLYNQLLESWNMRDGVAFAELFAKDGEVVGFDGSQMTGQAEIEATLRQIFTDHQTGRYVGNVRWVYFLAPDVAMLRAVVGMVPAGQSDLEPKLNTVQTLIAAKRQDVWRVTLFQNTPAQFHGKPELVEKLTEELRQLL